jgi:hypothetical protein
MLRHRPVRLVRARRMIGIVSSAAMMLDPISDTGRPVIGEGVETTHVSSSVVESTLAARQTGAQTCVGTGQCRVDRSFPCDQWCRLPGDPLARPVSRVRSWPTSAPAKGRRVRFIKPDKDPSDMNAMLVQRAAGMCLTTISQRRCDAQSEEDLC